MTRDMSRVKRSGRWIELAKSDRAWLDMVLSERSYGYTKSLAHISFDC
jgi:hypothetical protein